MTDRTMPDAHPLRSGDPATLGAYEILGRLGEGGQGSVFLGRRAGSGDGRPADYVAVKLLHAGLAGDAPARARFVRELDVAKRVARFCTAQVIDADLAGDQPYIVSEFVPGQSLHRLVQAEGPRTGGALERLAISTLTALYAIHQAGIVHRDFKPHNVMMGPDGPRVIDFGVARALGAAGETQNVGTPAYMAPEHFTGGTVGPAADMFAWGTTMVFAASGQPAFGNDDMAAVMHRILTGTPDLGGLPSPLREVVAASLAKEPERRPTAREAQERLVGAGSEMPAEALPPPPPPFPGGPSPAQVTEPGAGPDQGGWGATPPQPPPLPQPQLPQPQYVTAPPVRQEGQGAGRRRLLVPVAAAVAVGAVLAGGSVWAATRSGGGDSDRPAAGRQGPNGPAVEQFPGGSDRNTDKGSARPRNSPSTSAKPGDPKASGTPGTGRSTAPAGGGRGTSGGGTAPGGGTTSGPEPANKYTPQQVCNSGGRGGGYYVQRSMAVAGGKAYQLYNGSGYNCAVMIKTRNVGRASSVSVWIQASGGGKVADGGSYAWYAGPVYVSAAGKCVRFGSSSATSSYANCG
ncbi:serine/threonine protein kinase [Actinomadura viridis]|uniref:serine/threonine protein kinase n=1 Tax=Actinomadura viridis TaxID=58110 RepID=UPI0036967117